MYNVFFVTQLVAKVVAFYGKTFETIEDAKNHIDSNFGIIHFEHDPDGHDAADVFAGNMEVYAIERVKAVEPVDVY